MGRIDTDLSDTNLSDTDRSGGNRTSGRRTVDRRSGAWPLPSALRRPLAATVAALLLALSAVAAGPAPCSWACSCIPRTFDEAVAGSDLIATATVLSAEKQFDGDAIYELRLVQVWKGEHSSTVRLGTNTQTAACGLGVLEEGETLTLWASGADGEYGMSWCDYPTDAEDDTHAQLTRELGEPHAPPAPPEDDSLLADVPVIVVFAAGMGALLVGGLALIVLIAVVMLRRSRSPRI